METREQHVVDLILQLYSTKKDFALAINMPNTTLQSILRDISRASVGNLKKICEGLGVSMDDIVYYGSGVSKEPPLSAPGIPHSAHERALLSAYRKKTELQAAVDRLLEI